MVPAPTAWTAADDPPLRMRITMNIPMELESAARIFHKQNKANETIYTARRPDVSLNDDHHRGNIDMLNMYKATERFATVCEVWNVAVMSFKAAT